MSGRYTPSAYGSTLQAMAAENPSTAYESNQEMARAASGGAVAVDLIEGGGDPEGGGARGKVRVPRQLWRMVETLLESRAFQQPGLLVEKGIELEVQGIQEAVDRGSGFPQHCAHSMAEVRQSVAALMRPSPESTN